MTFFPSAFDCSIKAFLPQSHCFKAVTSKLSFAIPSELENEPGDGIALKLWWIDYASVCDCGKFSFEPKAHPPQAWVTFSSKRK